MLHLPIRHPPSPLLNLTAPTPTVIAPNLQQICLLIRGMRLRARLLYREGSEWRIGQRFVRVVACELL